jgi:hypothetical protein
MPVRQLSYKIVSFFQAVRVCLKDYKELYESSLSKELRSLYLSFLTTIVHEQDL